MFELEVLPAKHGDCLILHYGSEDEPHIMLIDGGPSGVYKHVLRQRLEELRDERSGAEPLSIDCVMVSHMDHDHIDGLLDMLAECNEAKADHKTPLVSVRTLWHNSFSDVIGDTNPQSSVGSASIKLAGMGASEADLPLHRPARLVLESVAEGRKLRAIARKQGISVNPEFDDGVAMERKEPIQHHNLSVHFLSPGRDRVEKLRSEWNKTVKILLDKEAKKQRRIDAAENLDQSVFNLASLVVLVESEGRRLLLTGDARSDHIMEAIERADLYASGVLSLDILKIPHHGSDRNVTVDFFRKVQANHYIFSGDGRHDNPSFRTLEMLFKARPDGAPYTIHWTYDPSEWKEGYPTESLQAVLSQARAKSVPFTEAVIRKNVMIAR